MHLNEWFSVAVLHQIDGYQFGSEGPVPYYYKTHSLYAIVMFIWGVVFLINFFWLIWSSIKGNRAGAVFGFGLSLILLFAMFVHSQIGLE